MKTGGQRVVICNPSSNVPDAVGRTQDVDGSACSGGGRGLWRRKASQSFVTHCVARHRNKGAPHGRRDTDHVVDGAFVLGVGDICNVEDVTHGVRQALQTAARLLGFGN